MRYRIDGLTDAKKALAELSPAFTEVAVKTIDDGTDIMYTEARKNVPFRTGALLLSIGKNTSAEGLQASVGSGLEYAKYQEFGTKKSRARPFLGPAYRIGARHIRREMRAWAKEAVQKIKTRTKTSRSARASARAGSE
jgi:HK97 gp10 family phage protein